MKKLKFLLLSVLLCFGTVSMSFASFPEGEGGEGGGGSEVTTLTLSVVGADSYILGQTEGAPYFTLEADKDIDLSSKHIHINITSGQTYMSAYSSGAYPDFIYGGKNLTANTPTEINSDGILSMVLYNGYLLSGNYTVTAKLVNSDDVTDFVTTDTVWSSASYSFTIKAPTLSVVGPVAAVTKGSMANFSLTYVGPTLSSLDKVDEYGELAAIIAVEILNSEDAAVAYDTIDAPLGAGNIYSYNTENLADGNYTVKFKPVNINNLYYKSYFFDDKDYSEYPGFITTNASCQITVNAAPAVVLPTLTMAIDNVAADYDGSGCDAANNYYEYDLYVDSIQFTFKDGESALNLTNYPVFYKIGDGEFTKLSAWPYNKKSLTKDKQDAVYFGICKEGTANYAEGDELGHVTVKYTYKDKTPATPEPEPNYVTVDVKTAADVTKTGDLWEFKNGTTPVFTLTAVDGETFDSISVYVQEQHYVGEDFDETIMKTLPQEYTATSLIEGKTYELKVEVFKGTETIEGNEVAKTVQNITITFKVAGPTLALAVNNETGDITDESEGGDIKWKFTTDSVKFTLKIGGNPVNLTSYSVFVKIAASGSGVAPAAATGLGQFAKVEAWPYEKKNFDNGDYTLYFALLPTGKATYDEEAEISRLNASFTIAKAGAVDPETPILTVAPKTPGDTTMNDNVWVFKPGKTAAFSFTLDNTKVDSVLITVLNASSNSVATAKLPNTATEYVAESLQAGTYTLSVVGYKPTIAEGNAVTGASVSISFTVSALPTLTVTTEPAGEEFEGSYQGGSSYKPTTIEVTARKYAAGAKPVFTYALTGADIADYLENENKQKGIDVEVIDGWKVGGSIVVKDTVTAANGFTLQKNSAALANGDYKIIAQLTADNNIELISFIRIGELPVYTVETENIGDTTFKFKISTENVADGWYAVLDVVDGSNKNVFTDTARTGKTEIEVKDLADATYYYMVRFYNAEKEYLNNYKMGQFTVKHPKPVSFKLDTVVINHYKITEAGVWMFAAKPKVDVKVINPSSEVDYYSFRWVLLNGKDTVVRENGTYCMSAEYAEMGGNTLNIPEGTYTLRLTLCEGRPSKAVPVEGVEPIEMKLSLAIPTLTVTMNPKPNKTILYNDYYELSVYDKGAKPEATFTMSNKYWKEDTIHVKLYNHEDDDPFIDRKLTGNTFTFATQDNKALEPGMYDALVTFASVDANEDGTAKFSEQYFVRVKIDVPALTFAIDTTASGENDITPNLTNSGWTSKSEDLGIATKTNDKYADYFCKYELRDASGQKVTNIDGNVLEDGYCMVGAYGLLYSLVGVPNANGYTLKLSLFEKIGEDENYEDIYEAKDVAPITLTIDVKAPAIVLSADSAYTEAAGKYTYSRGGTLNVTYLAFAKNAKPTLTFALEYADKTLSEAIKLVEDDEYPGDAEAAVYVMKEGEETPAAHKDLTSSDTTITLDLDEGNYMVSVNVETSDWKAPKYSKDFFIRIGEPKMFYIVCGPEDRFEEGGYYPAEFATHNPEFTMEVANVKGWFVAASVEGGSDAPEDFETMYDTARAGKTTLVFKNIPYAEGYWSGAYTATFDLYDSTKTLVKSISKEFNVVNPISLTVSPKGTQTYTRINNPVYVYEVKDADYDTAYVLAVRLKKAGKVLKSAIYTGATLAKGTVECPELEDGKYTLEFKLINLADTAKLGTENETYIWALDEAVREFTIAYVPPITLVVTPEQTYGEDESLKPLAYTTNTVKFDFSLKNAPAGKTIEDYLVYVQLYDEKYQYEDYQFVTADLVKAKSYTFGPMHNSEEYRAYFILMEVVDGDTIPVDGVENESGAIVPAVESIVGRVFSVDAKTPVLTFEPYSPNDYLELNNSTVTFTFKVDGEQNNGYCISGGMRIWDDDLDGWNPNGWNKYTFGSELVFANMADGYYSAGFWLYDKYYYSIDNNSNYSYLYINTKPQTAVEGAEEVKVAVYPNPTRGKFTVEVEEDAVVEIFAMNGQLVVRENVAAGLNAFELNNSGIYMVRVTAAGKVSTKRIIVR